MKTLAIIQARMQSRRLPQKINQLIAGKPLLRHVAERTREFAYRVGAGVVVNVPERDHELISGMLPDFLVIGVKDQEADVLGSYRQIARDLGATTVVRITGDCPCWDPWLGEKVYQLHQAMAAVDPYCLCTADTARTGWPDGLDCEVFSLNALNLAYDHAHTPYDREHVTSWMLTCLPTYAYLCSPGKPWRYGKPLKLSVDTAEDLQRVRGIVQHLKPHAYGIDETWEAYKIYTAEGLAKSV